MSAPTSCPTDIDLLKRLLLDMAQERSFDNVLKLIVDRLAGQPEVALARLWLGGADDICANCHMRDEWRVPLAPRPKRHATAGASRRESPRAPVDPNRAAGSNIRSMRRSDRSWVPGSTPRRS